VTAVLVIALVTLLALVALGAFLVHVLRVESAAWRALAATVTTGAVMLEHTHRVHDDTVKDARKLVKLATIGAEESNKSKRAVGSPDPEAVANKRIREETVMAAALRIQGLYREQGATMDIADCVREAQQLLAGELAG